jgi:hypothetical protein
VGVSETLMGMVMRRRRRMIRGRRRRRRINVTVVW